MRTKSTIPSATHKGFVHSVGTEAAFVHMEGGDMIVELTVRKDDGAVDWTERFRLPRGMKVDHTKPVILHERRTLWQRFTGLWKT